MFRLFVATGIMLSLELRVPLPGKTFPGPLPRSPQTLSLSRQPHGSAGRTGHCSFHAFQVLPPRPWGTASQSCLQSNKRGAPSLRISRLLSSVPLSLQRILLQTLGPPSPLVSTRESKRLSPGPLLATSPGNSPRPTAGALAGSPVPFLPLTELSAGCLLSGVLTASPGFPSLFYCFRREVNPHRLRFGQEENPAQPRCFLIFDVF